MNVTEIVQELRHAASRLEGMEQKLVGAPIQADIGLREAKARCEQVAGTGKVDVVVTLGSYGSGTEYVRYSVFAADGPQNNKYKDCFTSESLADCVRQLHAAYAAQAERVRLESINAEEAKVITDPVAHADLMLAPTF